MWVNQLLWQLDVICFGMTKQFGIRSSIIFLYAQIHGSSPTTIAVETIFLSITHGYLFIKNF